MKISQALLNKLFTFGIVLIIVVFFTLSFIKDPLSFYGNSIVYLLLSVGVGLLVPTALGYGWSVLIKLLDDSAGKPGENLTDSIHFWTAGISSFAIGYFWAKTVIPIIARSHSLSVWPINMFRFDTIFEGFTSWGWVIFSGLRDFLLFAQEE